LFDDQKDDDLLHYGVLGMKWRHRKGRDTAGPSTKRYKKQMENVRLSPKARKQYKDLYEKSKSHDKRMNDYVRSMSVGKTLALQIMTPIGATKYASLRADKVSRGRAVVSAALASNLGILSLGVSSLADNRNYGRSLSRRSK